MVINGQISMQEILVKNIEVGTIFEVVTSFGVILYFAFGTNLEAGANLEVCTHYKATRTGGASGGHLRQKINKREIFG